MGEVAARAEASLNLLLTTGISANAIREIYEKSAGGAGASTTAPSLSISLEGLSKLRSDSFIPPFALSVSTVIATEVATVSHFCRRYVCGIFIAILRFFQCWHESVFLPQLSSRFMKLTLQLFYRFELWIMEALGKDVTPSDDSGKIAEFDNDTSAPASSSGKQKPISSMPLLTAPVSELIMLAKDLVIMRQWITDRLVPLVSNRSFRRSAP